MPDFYAHCTQGQKVLERLFEVSEKTARSITNRHLYTIGLQGPDVLYFYRPLKTKDNPILQLADDIHRTGCVHFLNTVLRTRSVAPETDMFSYIMGFIGHFGLDSAAHPVVARLEQELDFDHVEMEIEFDKYLLLKDGKAPLFYKAHNSIVLSKAELIAVTQVYRCLLPIITVPDMRRAFRTFRRVKRFFYAPFPMSQQLRFFLLRCCNMYNALQGHIMKTYSNPKSGNTNTVLDTVYESSIETTVRLMINFYEHITEQKPLDPLFKNHFM